MADEPTDNPFAATGPSTASTEGVSAVVAGDAPAVPLEIGAILSRCWALFTGNVGLVLGAILIPGVVSMGFAGVDGVMQAVAAQSSDLALSMGMGRLVVQVLSFVVQVFFSLGVARIFVNLASGRPAEIGMLIGQGDKYLRGLGATFLVSLATLVGLILLVVPGIIVSLGMYLFLYALVDQDLGVIDAMTESWRLTHGYKLFLFLLTLVVGIGIIVITIVTCGLGALIAIPVLSLVQGVVYHSLVSEKGTAATA